MRAGRVVPEDLPGIKLERADVLPGGLAIMSAVFDELGIVRMETGDGALRSSADVRRVRKNSELRGLSTSFGGAKRLILRLFGSIPKYLARWISCCWVKLRVVGSLARHALREHYDSKGLGAGLGDSEDGI